jgi:aminoglycoside phosphotransferase family enzyme/predicted kinase
MTGASSGRSPEAAVRETHSAVVLLVGDRAFKMKKPVDLGFLDFRAREARAAACQRELVLNRRMARDVYLGVADVLGPDGTPCEHVLVMRRMPEERRLALLVRQGIDVRAEIRQVARSLAAFHATARTSREISECGRQAALRQRWIDNIETLRDLKPRLVAGDTIDRIEGLAHHYVAGRAPLLDSRIDSGLVRDGHGDLLADDIFCLADGPRTLDCLDFDDRLRWMDVLDDIACLAMDLERLGDPSAGRALLRDYVEFSGTRHPESLSHHYIAYRAVMRAKIAAIRSAARCGPGERDAEEAALLCGIGLRHLEQGRVRLILVGGAPGSGKTTLAAALGDTLPAAVLSSDRVRKELNGLPPTRHVAAPFEEGIYGREMTERTYAVLARRAASLVAMGESVVVDATFARAQLRSRFREVAGTASADLVELRCAAPDAVRLARLESREALPDGLSDAGPQIGRKVEALTDSWPEAAPVDTSASVGGALSAAGRAMKHAACG